MTAFRNRQAKVAADVIKERKTVQAHLLTGLRASVTFHSILFERNLLSGPVNTGVLDVMIRVDEATFYKATAGDNGAVLDAVIEQLTSIRAAGKRSVEEPAAASEEGL